MKLFDVVALVGDLPEEGLREGAVGTVVDVYHEPEAYEVEFDDGEGVELARLALRPERLRPSRPDR